MLSEHNLITLWIYITLHYINVICYANAIYIRVNVISTTLQCQYNFVT